MKIFKDRHSLQREIYRQKGISFVPTMGGLHSGHLSLIKKSKKYGYKTLVSIFVNPKQFNKIKDYKSYPRNFKKDIKKLKNLKVHYLYIPSYNDIYGFKTLKKIHIDKISKYLCGKYRKGHFEGVLNVVNRFLEIIKPKNVFLGKKDYQQLFLIKKHIIKRKINTKIIECNTVREKNGVACSTRNSKLNKKQLIIASNIYHYLFNFKKQLKRKNNIVNLDSIKKVLLSMGADKIEYIEKYNLHTFKKNNNTKNKFNLFVAYYINKIRLIDNL